MSEHSIVTVSSRHNTYRLHIESNVDETLLNLGFPLDSLNLFMNSVRATGYETKQLDNGKFVEVEIP